MNGRKVREAHIQPIQSVTMRRFLDPRLHGDDE